ncbi:MAG: glycosyltransferase family 39 protein [Deltaproteobacteria bacterium]|nr:glycosyltransferase family 39 protein [Candidatus Deferrimicrobium borealis]
MLGGPETIFPPLYPVLIGALSVVTGDTEVAGRLISMAMGTLLPVPMFLLTEMVFDRRAALSAALLVAISPMLIALSCSVYSEGIYFTMWLTGIYFAMRTLRGDKVRYAALSGLFLGFAYLVRPEAMGYALLTAIWILAAGIFRKSTIRSALPRAATVLLVALAVAAPYVTWLSINSGNIHLEGKSAYNNITTRRIHQGMEYSEATRGLGPNGEAEGPHLYSDQFEILKKEKGGGSTLFNNILQDFPRRWLKLGWIVATLRILGSPILAVLAMVGFLTTGVRNRKFLFEGFLLAIAAAYLLVLLSIGVMWPRYLFPIALLLVPWAGAGVSRISGWIQDRVERPSGANTSLARFATAAAVCLLLAGVVIPSVGAVLETDEFSMSRATLLKDAGRWLDTYKGGEKTIMGNSYVFVHYSQGTLNYLPYASGPLALEYIRKKHPDFIALYSLDSAPYIEEWMQSGIPDPCAREIKRFQQGGKPGGFPKPRKIVLYEWACRKTTSTAND